MAVLLDHELTEMGDLSHSWPSLNVPLPELKKRTLLFKKQAFRLLYKVVDSMATLPSTDILFHRRQQAIFLEGMTIVELATLGVMVEVMGQGFFTMTLNSLNVAKPSTTISM